MVATAGPGVAVVGTRWLAASAGDVEDGDGWLGPDERAKQTTLAYAKRRGDWRLKRWAAKQALTRVTGVAEPHRLQVVNTDDGVPVAVQDGQRLPLTVSLTDRAGTAVCTLAPPASVLGCDLELVEPRSAAFVGDWLTPTEQATVAAAADAAVAANLIWSAKESALKALGIGLRRPTRQVEVAVEPDALDTAGGEAWAPLQVVVAEGRMAGWWRRYGELVLTVVSDAGSGPPVSL